MPEVTEPIVVSSNAAGLDALKAAFRYLTVILTAFPAILFLLKTKDIIGLIEYFKSAEGAAVISALIALGTAGYGIFRTHKRGAQVVDVAQSPQVPNTVAKIG
jgi:hypothetical protein